MKTRTHKWMLFLLGAAVIAGCDLRPDEEAISRVMPVTRPPESFEDDPSEINDRSPVDAVATDRQLVEREAAEQRVGAPEAEQRAPEERIVAKPDTNRTIPTSTVVEVEDDSNATETNTAVAPSNQPESNQPESNQNGRANASQKEPSSLQTGQEVQHAVVVLRGVGDSGVEGTIYLDQSQGGLHVHGKVSGLTPGKHGFHIHQYGDLTDQQSGESAGGHYDPRGKPHGAREAKERHIGDFGNIEAGQDGTANVDFNDPVATLNGDNHVLGRAIVVHAGEDNFTQPSGDAGPRVAFGIIGVRNANSQSK